MNKKKSSVCLLLLFQTLALAVTVYASSLEQKQAGVSCADGCTASPAISLATSLSQQPVTIHIPADYATIQQGIDAAEYGDIVLVAAGTYPENIDMKNGVIVRGTGGSLSTADDPADDSIIDGEETGRVVDFSYSVENATLEGFTITRGRGEIRGGNISCYGKANTIKDNLIVDGRTTGSYGGYGGGIYLACDSAKVVGNVIQNNWAWAHGGGIDIHASNVVIEDNVISNNQADSAGGLFVSGSAVFIRKNIIDANFADSRHGGGIYAASANSIVIENNTLVNNIAKEWGYGGAIYVNQVGPITIINNIISANRNALNRTGGIHFVSCPDTLTLSYNNTYNNVGSDYAGCTPGQGSISADPMFVDATNQDYHLQSGSPMIDAGDPDPAYNDAEDSANPGFALYPSMGTVRNDMGAYGGQGGMEPPIPLESVIIEGPTSGEISHTYHFSATVSPINAMDTADYTWEPAPLSGQGTNNVTYQWALPGEKQIMVTAANAAGSVTDAHTIFIGYINLIPVVPYSWE